MCESLKTDGKENFLNQYAVAIGTAGLDLAKCILTIDSQLDLLDEDSV
jgi:hypothetical protein